MKVDAVVLAGSRNNSRLKILSRVDCEAFISIGDFLMIDYVVNAILGAERVGRVAVVGPVELLEEHFGNTKNLLFTPPGETMLQSMHKGMNKLNTDRHVLVATADIPLITSEAIDEFIKLCQQKDNADLYYSIISREVSEGKYPEVQRTYVHLREGTFTGGNLFLIKPGIVPRCLSKGEELVRLRKSPLALSRKIGLIFILKFLLRRLSLRDAEDKFSQLLNIKGVGVISPHPEVGIDVDKPSDLELVRRVLGNKQD